MRSLGRGGYGEVLTDGKLAYKFLHDDPDLQHYCRFFSALNRLTGCGLGDDIRPALRSIYPGGPLLPSICMPIYGPTLNITGIDPKEIFALRTFLINTITTFKSAGVCHRDWSLTNVARRLNNNEFVLLDMDSAFIMSDGPKLTPEFGLYCPFYGYPRDVLPNHLHNLAFDPAVSLFTMWFSAQVLYNIIVLGHTEQFYLPQNKPIRFFGTKIIFERAYKTANCILPTDVIAKAQHVMDGHDTNKSAWEHARDIASWLGANF